MVMILNSNTDIPRFFRSPVTQDIEVGDGSNMVSLNVVVLLNKSWEIDCTAL